MRLVQVAILRQRRSGSVTSGVNGCCRGQGLNEKSVTPRGFSKVKGSSTRSSLAQSAAGNGGKRQWQDSDSWEFKHPKFRRGRKELLVGIKRRKDGGRMKRRRVDTHSDVLQNLKRDLDQVTADLQAVDDKVDDIKSLLLGMSVRPGPSSATPQPPQDGGVFGYETNPAFMPTAAAHAGGFERWGGATVGGPDPYMYGAPLTINYLSPRPPVDQRSWWQPPSQRPRVSRDEYFVSQQPLYQAPPVACFPVNTALSRQLPLDGSPRGDGLPREHTGKGMDDSTVRSPNREGGDHRASFSSGTDSADPGTEGVWRSAPAPNTDQLSAFRGGGGGGSGSRINGGTGDLQQDQSEGKMSMLEVLSHSAATAVETSGEKG
eukprot:jgi/Undpi1/5820/HiC_scaffold_2.g01094.m1